MAMAAHELKPLKKRRTAAQLQKRADKRARRSNGERVDRRVVIERPDVIGVESGPSGMLSFFGGVIGSRRRR
jgi:hypothetical protein